MDVCLHLCVCVCVCICVCVYVCVLQGPPSDTIPVDNGGCQGSKMREVKVAAETGYNFTVCNTCPLVYM